MKPLAHDPQSRVQRGVGSLEVPSLELVHHVHEAVRNRVARQRIEDRGWNINPIDPAPADQEGEVEAQKVPSEDSVSRKIDSLHNVLQDLRLVHVLQRDLSNP
jgi:hypothetical protein